VQERVTNLLPNSIFVSAATEGGLEPLRRSLLAAVRAARPVSHVRIPGSDGRLIADVHRNGEVLEQGADGDYLVLTARLDEATASRLRKEGAVVELALEMPPVLVTGGAGFIGSAVVRTMVAQGRETVTLDTLTYAGSLASLGEALHDPRHHFEQVDVCDAEAVRDVFRRHAPAAVLHLAAESHVDRSIDEPAAFVRTNVIGSYVVLEESLRYWRALPAERAAAFRVVHVSTDEVYGELGAEGRFTEDSPHRPNSPYAASKAAADHFARAWHRTYGLPVITTNCSNNYGPYQYPEKLIPLAIRRALSRRPVPVYGTGENVRDWLYVDDHVRALLAALERGEPGRTYAFGGGSECTTLEMARAVCALLDELAPRGAPYEELIALVPDRPGHDHRYAIAARRARAALGWEPRQTLASGLRRTVAWYLENDAWCEAVSGRRYGGERIGLGAAR
jgi:dTDP-glucose 4,6-dehydratase